ncbi:MAG: hypothetical protein Q9228_002717 [Teloschistes exilis]
MSTRLNILYCVSLAVCSVQRMTQASFLHLAPSQIIAKIANSPQNGSTVPGDSPVKFHNNPANDLFRIETLDMYPNPCVVESYCGVLIRGEFTTSLENTTPRVSFNVTSHLPNNRTGLIRGEDVFCNWADIIQDGDDDDYNNHHLQTKARAQALAQANVRRPLPNLDPDPLHATSRKQKRRDKIICPLSKEEHR